VVVENEVGENKGVVRLYNGGRLAQQSLSITKGFVDGELNDCMLIFSIEECFRVS